MTADLRAVLAGIDEGVEAAQGLVRQLVRMRRTVAELADHVDIDERIDRENGIDYLAEDGDLCPRCGPACVCDIHPDVVLATRQL